MTNFNAQYSFFYASLLHGFALLKILFILLHVVIAFSATCLQCFDAVGWAAGRASGL